MWEITHNEDGTYEWVAFQSAYGVISGTETTLAKAKIELAIGEARLLEEPYPPKLVKKMRKDPEKYAQAWPDPPEVQQVNEDVADDLPRLWM